MKILHAPMHTGWPKAESMKLVLKLNPTSVAMTEMSKAADRAQAKAYLDPKYRMFQTFNEKLSNLQFDNVIYLKDHPDIKLERQTVRKISPKVGILGIGNTRFLRWRVWSYDDNDFVHFATHWNAGIQNKKTGELAKNKRAVVTTSASEYMEAKIKQYVDANYVVAVTGDFNWRSDLPKSHTWNHSPEAMFDRLGLKYRTDRLDRLAWYGMKLDSYVTYPPRINMQDHTWLLGRFTV